MLGLNNSLLTSRKSANRLRNAFPVRPRNDGPNYIPHRNRVGGGSADRLPLRKIHNPCTITNSPTLKQVYEEDVRLLSCPKPGVPTFRTRRCSRWTPTCQLRQPTLCVCCAWRSREQGNNDQNVHQSSPRCLLHRKKQQKLLICAA